MGAADQAKQLRMIVKVFVSCLLALCAASSESSSSESGSGEFRGPGLYFSPIEVDLACTAGSPLGAKLASAFETCLGGVEALNPEQVGEVASERRRRRPNKGRKCPTVEQIKAKMGQGMEGDWCVLSQLGWIDENGNEKNETSTADLMSLKPEVLAELDESAMKTCAEERVEMMQKMMERKHKRCAKKFSEEDKAELMRWDLRSRGTTASRRCSTRPARRVSSLRSTLSSRPRQWPLLQLKPQQQVPQLQQMLQLLLQPRRS